MSRLKTKDYEQLGRLMENVYESNQSRRDLYKTAFLKGVFSGLGGVLGATILVALAIWVLTLLKRIPLIGPFTQKVRTTIQAY